MKEDLFNKNFKGRSINSGGADNESYKTYYLLIVFTLIFGIIASFHESRLGKWIDTEVYEFIYSSKVSSLLNPGCH